LYSFLVFLKSLNILGHLEYSEAKAALTRRTPRLGQMTSVSLRGAPWSAAAGSCRTPFPGKFASTIRCDCLVLVSRVPEVFNFIGAFGVLRSESGADTPHSKARPNDVQSPRGAPWSAAAGSCRFPFPGQVRINHLVRLPCARFACFRKLQIY